MNALCLMHESTFNRFEYNKIVCCKYSTVVYQVIRVVFCLTKSLEKKCTRDWYALVQYDTTVGTTYS